MPKEYARIACTVGTILRDRLRQIELEPLPERLTELLGKLSERDGSSAREAEKEEAPGKSDRGSLRT
jgi:hypothetical protein